MIRVSDIRGLARLVVAATTAGTDVVEAMHGEVTSLPFVDADRGRTRGITGLTYSIVRGVARVVGTAVDGTLDLIPTLQLPQEPGQIERGALVAALNGVLGDYLAATNNPLAIPMTLRPRGEADLPTSGSKLVVLLHGLCMNARQWQSGEHDHGVALARDLGYTPLYLDYNSGLHISLNGRAFAALLEQTLDRWTRPVEELVILGHSMGGLVARSACRAAAASDHRWLKRLRALVFVGVPHHGAPLERGGNWAEVMLGATPYAWPLARLGRVRSAGITDLRHAALCDEDWAGVDRFVGSSRLPAAVPLPAGVPCFAMAAALGQPDDARKNRLFGDGLVPLPSALGLHDRPERHLAIPASRRWIGYGLGHLDLLGDARAYARLLHWLATLGSA